MAGSISNSFALMKASAHVLKMDKELLVLPMMSGVASLLVMASFAAPIALTGAGDLFTNGDMSYPAMAITFLFYMVQYSVIFFFNAALVGASLIRLDGGDPTVGDGLAIASKRMGSILGYAAIAATVGMILRMIAERGGPFARLGSALGGMAWTLATYLAVPVLVTKNVGPVDAIKESGAIFKRTWGEQVAANFGLSWAMFFVVIVWTALSFGVGYVASMISPAAVIPVVVSAVVGYVFIGLVGSALGGIYSAALYRYAVTGESGYFDAALMGRAFRKK